jgi:hypothetical protein
MDSKQIRGLCEAYVAVYDQNLRNEIFIEEDLSFVDDLSDNELDEIMENLFLSGEIDINECFDSLDYVLTEARVTSSDDRQSGSARVTTSAERPSKVKKTAERQKQVRVGRIAQAAQRVGERASKGAYEAGSAVSGSAERTREKISSATQKVKGFLGKIGRAVKAGAKAAKKEFSGEAGREAEARTTGRELRRAARRQASASRGRDTSEFSTTKKAEKPSDPWRGSETKPSARPSVTTKSVKALSGSSVRGELPPAKDSDRRQAAKAKLAKAAAGSTAKGIRFAGERVGQLASQRAHTGHQSALEKFRKKSGISEDLLNDILNSIFEDMIYEGYVDTYENALYVVETLSETDIEEIVESYLIEEVETLDLYDVVLEHLLDEGYADTVESAEEIMVNMSEEWREEIIGEKADNTIRLVYGKGGKGVPIKDGSGNVLRKPNVGFAQQGRDFRMATSAADERASWAAGERGIINRRNAARLQNAHKKSIQQLNAKSGDGDYDAPEGHHYDTNRSDRAARRRRETGR